MHLTDKATPIDKASLFLKKFVYKQLTHAIWSFNHFGMMEPMTAKGVDLSEQTQQCQVMISPTLSSDDYKTLMNNCTKSEYDKAIQQSFLLTMNKMSFIRSVFGIEREFERYY